MNAGRTVANRFVTADLKHDLLGRGGMGNVYRAIDTQTGELVAVKALDPGVLARDPGLLERFLREGEALRRLNHPNIVHMIAACEEDGQHYLVMEYVVGGSLEELLGKEGRLPPARTLEIALDLADALTRAHRLGIIHRDLKPANVLLAPDGTPRLADFGIAHVTTGPALTQTGMLIGTVDYLSPEACQGEALDERADIWAFGVLLFEMLSGRVPFPGANLTAALTAILTQPVPDLAELVPGLPDGLVDLVYRMLEKDRQQRIPSVRLVGAELEALLKGRGPARHESRFAPPAPAAHAPRHNLPAQATPFIGRPAELAELARLLADPAVRLVTIVGSGGMGKTRLALEAAVCETGRFADGVYLVPLAPLQAAEAIIPAIAAAIGYRFREAGEPRQHLLDYLHQRTMLLVLDNFEHLLEGVALVSDMVLNTPGVRILSTSRVRLNLQGEHLLRLGGMDFPLRETPRDASDYSSVKLFLQCTRRVRPDLVLGADDLRHIARICRLVEGMPLGIVLAAAWLAMLTPAEIAAEIGQSLDFLQTQARDVPERQRSLRVVFDRTWSLLAPREQEVFRGLSVFRGGFTREAVQQVTGATLRELICLVDKSLLQRDPAGRYGVHELLRQYAGEQLVEHEEAAVLCERHVAYLLSLAGLSGEMPGKLPDKDWLQRMFVERDNLRAAMNWCLNGGDAEAGLRLAVRLRWFWYSSLPLWEGCDWLRRLLAANPGATLLRARALEILAQIVCDLGEYPQARTLLEESVGLSDALGDLLGVANATFKLSWIAMETGDLARARSLLERSLALSQDLNNPGQSAYILHSMANLAYLEDDLVRARKLYEQVADQQRRLGMITLRSVLADLGCVLIRLGELDRCCEILRESLSFYLEAGGIKRLVVEAFAYLANARGQPQRAACLLGASETLVRNTGEQIDTYLRSDHERNLASLRTQLGQAVFETAWAEGQALAVEQVVELAMSDRLDETG